LFKKGQRKEKGSKRYEKIICKKMKEILTSNASGAAGLARAVKKTSLQPFL
jgi:hypothetical protein